MALLSPTEEKRRRAFVFARDRDIYLATRVLVRTVASHYTGVAPEALDFGLGPHGKPNLSGSQLGFNLSNTRGLVAGAFAWETTLGIDVEEARAPRQDMADQFFAPPETAFLHALPAEARVEAFYAFWTLKESYLKANGAGLSKSLDSFAFTLQPTGLMPFGELNAGEAREWQAWRNSPTPSHRLAVCVHTRRPPVVVQRWLPAAAWLDAR